MRKGEVNVEVSIVLNISAIYLYKPYSYTNLLQIPPFVAWKGGRFPMGIYNALYMFHG